MFDLDMEELREYVKGDVPYLDITTHLQNVDDKIARLSIFTREDIVLSCTEETRKIAQMHDCEVKKFVKSGRLIKAGEVFFVIKGDYNDIHKVWRLCQILLEYSCKIATYTHEMVSQTKEVNPNCQILGTRKTIPFAKRFSIKALLNGGGFPHRLGLSESILFFAQHRVVYKNDDEFFAQIPIYKQKAPEKKIVIETENFSDAKKCFESGADVLQLDKIPLEEVEKIVTFRNKNYPHVKILCAGGINVKNAKQYANLGIDSIVTSAMYSCGLANLSSKIEIL